MDNIELEMRSLSSEKTQTTVFNLCKFELQHQNFDEGKLNVIKNHLIEVWAENRDTVNALFILKSNSLASYKYPARPRVDLQMLLNGKTIAYPQIPTPSLSLFFFSLSRSCTCLPL